jgi:FlaA1/EpsC-like NDP-sugar epimerase
LSIPVRIIHFDSIDLMGSGDGHPSLLAISVLHSQELWRIDVGSRYLAANNETASLTQSRLSFLDDEHEKLAQNQDILGTISDLEIIVSSYCINIIVIAIASDAFGITRNIVERLRLTPVKIWIVPDANQLARYHSDVEYLADILAVDIRPVDFRKTTLG